MQVWPVEGQKDEVAFEDFECSSIKQKTGRCEIKLAKLFPWDSSRTLSMLAIVPGPMLFYMERTDTAIVGRKMTQI